MRHQFDLRILAGLDGLQQHRCAMRFALLMLSFDPRVTEVHLRRRVILRSQMTGSAVSMFC